VPVFGMNVLACTRRSVDNTELADELFGPAELPALLAASDYVLVCVRSPHRRSH